MEIGELGNVELTRLKEGNDTLVNDLNYIFQ